MISGRGSGTTMRRSVGDAACPSAGCARRELHGTITYTAVNASRQVNGVLFKRINKNLVCAGTLTSREPLVWVVDSGVLSNPPFVPGAGDGSTLPLLFESLIAI